MFPLVASWTNSASPDRWSRRRSPGPNGAAAGAPARLEVGAMIEAPSLLWHLDALLPLADFVSVGTNDLMQYMFAADRGNPRVSDRYDPLSPPLLRALKTIQAACVDTGTPASVCGEMAGRPLEAFALVALGFERLSMPPSGIGGVKQMVLVMRSRGGSTRPGNDHAQRGGLGSRRHRGPGAQAARHALKSFECRLRRLARL